MKSGRIQFLILPALILLAAPALAQDATSRMAPLDGRSPRVSQPLTPEQESQTLEFLKTQRPERYADVIRLRESHPDSYREAIGAAWRWRQRWIGLPKEAQQAALAEQEARLKVARLLQAMREAKPGVEKDKLEAELRKAVARQFEAEQASLTQRLIYMEQRLQRMRVELADRSKRREEIIAEQFDRLLKNLGQSLAPAALRDALVGRDVGRGQTERRIHRDQRPPQEERQ